jgi:hypothetical protein
MAKRWAIVHSRDRLRSIDSVMKEQHGCESVVRQWIDRYKATGDILDAPRSGRKPAMQTADRGTALQMLMGGQHGGSAAVSKVYCQRLYAGMPRGLQSCKARGGNMIGH